MEIYARGVDNILVATGAAVVHCAPTDWSAVQSFHDY
jgi:hypothetical protein